MSDKPQWTRVAKTSELVGPGPHAVSGGGRDLVVLRTARGLKAFEGLCPHQGALLGEGELDGDSLVCRNHRWRFSVETGKREGGSQCLRACPIRDNDGEIEADVSVLAGDKSEAARVTRRLEDLPGPPGLPFFGSALVLRPSELHLQFEEWAIKYGTPYKVRLGRRVIVAVRDMDEMLRVTAGHLPTWVAPRDRVR